MISRAQIRFLPDGKRLHLQDGPIDLIIEAFGPLAEIEKAYRAASARFETVLDELCSELSFLRQPCSTERGWPSGAVARRMFAAVMPYAPEFFYYADGSGGGRCGGRDSRGHDCSGSTFPRLRQ